MTTSQIKQRLQAAARAGWPALIVALAIAWQYRAPLLGRVWYFEDIAAYFVPLYTAASHAMRSGSFPTWELGAWSGQPLVGDPQLGCFYPFNWLWMAIHPVTLYAWLGLGHAAVGAAGMWALARARGRSSTAAALAALTLALGGFFVLQVRHGMFTASSAWLIWLWWAIERYGQTRRLGHFLWIALSGALALLGGGWSMLPYGALVMALVVVAVVVRAPDKRLGLGLGLGGAAALAVALAAVQLWTALAHARESPRALGFTAEAASTFAWPSWRYALTLVFPTLYGDDARGTWVGASNQWELSGYGIGLIATLLALGSLRLRERRGERLALLLLTLAACELARGSAGWLHPLLYRVPVFGSLRCPARALYVWTLTAPVLAADGLDALFPPRTASAPSTAPALLGARARALLPLLVLVAVAAELVVTWRSENPSTTRAVAERRPDAIAWLRDHRLPGRAINDVHLPQRYHNMGLAWGVESAGGYHPLPIWRYLHLLWMSNHGRPYPSARLMNDLTAQGLWRFASPIVDLLSVQWVVAPHDRPIDAPGFERVFSGADGTDLWRNHDILPRVFIVFHAQRVADEAAAARVVADPGWHPGRVVVVEEEAPGVPEPGPDAELRPAARVRELVRTEQTSLDVAVDLPAPGVLVVAEPWYPGWQVLVDGKPAQTMRVDYALRGVALPAGVHQIDMELTCAPLRRGGLVSCLGLLVAGALASFDARRRRRGARPSPAGRL